MRIWLKPDVMAQYKLVPTDVSAALAEQNIEAAPGQFGERGDQTFQYTIRYKGRLQQTNEFEDIVIKALPDGNVLRLGDVADIELGRLAYTFNNTVNGHKAVSCIVYQMAGTNATETISNLEEVLAKAQESLPTGLNINIAQNANDFLFASIHEVIKTLIEAFILVFIVVYIFLQDMRSTLIPAIAIPVALVATFFVLKLIGFSVNLLTLSAMVLAIAIVVDDAIVVVEGVHAKLDQGYKSSREASIDAMSELGGAIVSITLVMMSVFIPVSFMGGTAGTFYRQFGITMAIAIGFSALNALTLSPALCAIFLKPHDEGHGTKKMTRVERFHTAFNAAYDSILKKYKKHVVFFIHKKWLSFGLVTASIILLVFFMKVTPTGMVPNEDTGTIMGAVTLPPGTSQERAMEILNRVDSLVAAEPAVDSRTVISGFGFIGGQGPSYGSIIIKLKDWEERSMMQNSDVVVGTLFMRAQKIIKDAQVLFFAPPMIPGYSASSVEPVMESFSAALAPGLDLFETFPGDTTFENLQARIRGIMVSSLANRARALVLNTGNKSECAVGYSTLYGDTVGALGVIADLTKTEVYTLAGWYNHHRQATIIPQAIFDKAPSAELRPGQKDSDSLPPYDVLDPVLESLIFAGQTAAQPQEADEGLRKEVRRKLFAAEFKRRQEPLGLHISRMPFGTGWQVPVAGRYRMP